MCIPLGRISQKIRKKTKRRVELSLSDLEPRLCLWVSPKVTLVVYIASHIIAIVLLASRCSTQVGRQGSGQLPV